MRKSAAMRFFSKALFFLGLVLLLDAAVMLALDPMLRKTDITVGKIKSAEFGSEKGKIEYTYTVDGTEYTGNTNIQYFMPMQPVTVRYSVKNPQTSRVNQYKTLFGTELTLLFFAGLSFIVAAAMKLHICISRCVFAGTDLSAERAEAVKLKLLFIMLGYIAATVLIGGLADKLTEEENVNKNDTKTGISWAQITSVQNGVTEYEFLTQNMFMVKGSADFEDKFILPEGAVCLVYYNEKSPAVNQLYYKAFVVTRGNLLSVLMLCLVAVFVIAAFICLMQISERVIWFIEEINEIKDAASQ